MKYCKAFLDYGTDNERLCGEKKVKICDQCKEYFCEKHAYEKDKYGEPAKYHRHFVCWASHIFEMYNSKKDIPKEVYGVCPRCNNGSDRKKSQQPELFVVKDNKFERVCGLCKSEIIHHGS